MHFEKACFVHTKILRVLPSDMLGPLKVQLHINDITCKYLSTL